MNILEADRPRKAKGVPPAFLRACCLGWLRRSPRVLLGGGRDPTFQRISLLMISRALEFAGSKIVFDGEERERRKASLAGAASEVLRAESADNLTRHIKGRRKTSVAGGSGGGAGGKADMMKKDTIKLLKSKASTMNFITTSGCINVIAHMLAHYDP